jgi:hypothetical protein
MSVRFESISVWRQTPSSIVVLSAWQFAIWYLCKIILTYIHWINIMPSMKYKNFIPTCRIWLYWVLTIRNVFLIFFLPWVIYDHHLLSKTLHHHTRSKLCNTLLLKCYNKGYDLCDFSWVHVHNKRSDYMLEYHALGAFFNLQT